MNGRLLIIAGLALLSASCSKPSKTVPAPETIFDSTGLQAITSSFNKKQVTMSVLYGNPLAMSTALEGKKEHVPGEVFILVSWEQQPSPYWFGANINDKMKLIEKVRVNAVADGVDFDYVRIIKGKKAIPQELIADRKNRIKFIINQDASVFP